MKQPQQRWWPTTASLLLLQVKNLRPALYRPTRKDDLATIMDTLRTLTDFTRLLPTRGSDPTRVEWPNARATDHFGKLDVIFILQIS